MTMKKKKVTRQQVVSTKNKKAAPAKSSVSRTSQVSSKEYYRAVFIVLILTFLAYIPALKAGFVNWDDPDYVNQQFFTRGLSDLKYLLTTPIQGNYHPLTILSLAFNFVISGMNAWSYHVLNVILHLVNCVLVFRFVFLLSNKNTVAAFITAALFGIHPMHVESVAWVTERKDVLYGLFFIAGLTSYTKYVDTGSRTQYGLTLLFLILSLLSKPAAVVFPLALFCVDILRKRPLAMKLFVEKVPFFVFPILLGIMTYIAQKQKGAIDVFAFDALTRILMGFYGIMMYVVKMVIPVNLSPFYPYAPINQRLPTEYYLSPLFFVGLLVLCIYAWKKNRVVPFGILFYLVNLLLVLQFLPVGSAVIADRYTYLPYIGLFFILGWLFSRFVKQQGNKAYYMLAPVIALLSFLTYKQCTIWNDSAALWDHAIKITPSSRAYDNRARLFNDEKNIAKALEYYIEALKINAVDKEAYTNRGNIYFNAGKYDSAYLDYKQATSIDSTYYPALDNMGALMAMRGKYDSALNSLNRCLNIKPDYVSAYRNRALTFMELKRYNDAIRDFESFLKYQPNDPDIYNAIGVCLRMSEKYAEALAIINKALNIKKDPHFYLNRSYCFNGLKDLDQARKDALAAKAAGVPLDPPYAKELGLE
jgi:protein O-mannosyl-transferase